MNLRENTTCYNIDYFCELTKSVYEMNSHHFEQIKHAQDKWSSLADLWDNLRDEYDLYIVDDAIAHIKYGHDIDVYENNHKSLVKAVCRELCSDSPAGCAWRKHPLFKRALRETSPEDDHDFFCRLFSAEGLRVSLQHCRYLDMRMMLRYWSTKGVCKDKCKIASNYIAKYESFISTLCPTATTWNSVCWIDVENIYKALRHEYGRNFPSTPREYDILINLFRMRTTSYKLSDNKELDIVRCVCAFNCLPLPVAQVLWPSRTKICLVKLFTLAGQRAEELSLDEDIEEDVLRPCYVCDVNYSLLSKSGLFSVMQNWVRTAELLPRDLKIAKKVIFDTNIKK